MTEGIWEGRSNKINENYGRTENGATVVKNLNAIIDKEQKNKE